MPELVGDEVAEKVVGACVDLDHRAGAALVVLVARTVRVAPVADVADGLHNEEFDAVVRAGVRLGQLT